MAQTCYIMSLSALGLYLCSISLFKSHVSLCSWCRPAAARVSRRLFVSLILSGGELFVGKQAPHVSASNFILLWYSRAPVLQLAQVEMKVPCIPCRWFNSAFSARRLLKSLCVSILLILLSLSLLYPSLCSIPHTQHIPFVPSSLPLCHLFLFIFQSLFYFLSFLFPLLLLSPPLFTPFVLLSSSLPHHADLFYLIFISQSSVYVYPFLSSLSFSPSIPLHLLKHLLYLLRLSLAASVFQFIIYSAVRQEPALWTSVPES